AYEPGSNRFVVSPINARKELSAFLKGAKKQLLIYDPEISDPAMTQILADRVRAGVDIRIIGKLMGKRDTVPWHKPDMRMHTRTIVRDGSTAFIGSQSLRELELDSRREIGIIFKDGGIIARLIETFEQDWARKPSEARPAEGSADVQPATKVAK